jgi:uncharacterized protein
MAFTHNSKVSDQEAAWAAVDKTRLPRLAHADQGDPDTKTTWKYPHHWVEDGGGLNDMGVYTTGTMYLSRRGLAAARQRASQQGVTGAVMEHLDAHAAAIGMGESNADLGRLEYSALGLEFKLQEIQDVGTFAGYASVFSKPIPHPFFGFDIVAPGAFAKTLSTRGASQIKMLWQHGLVSPDPVGEWTSITEDDRGLHVTGQLFMELSGAADRLILLRKGAINSLSIGFSSQSKKNTFDPETNTRTLSEVELFEISPVTFPAQVSAKIRSVKSAQSLITVSEFEDFLREAGFSHTEATQLASAGWSALRRDVAAGVTDPSLDGVLQALRDARAALHSPTGGSNGRS